MRYMGGKSRIAKHVAAAILADTPARQRYVEPFMGGGAITEHLAPHFHAKVLNDLHPELMAMWDAVLNNGWNPPGHITYEDYQELRYADEVTPLRGFVGFGCSFGGRWFEGYARDGNTNFAATSRRVVLRQARAIGPSDCHSVPFSELDVRPGDVVYCDPPYEGTKTYASKLGKFNHAHFWRIAEGWARAGAHVYVSEYRAPAGWAQVWQRVVVGQLDPRKQRTAPTEKLFTFR